MIESLIGSFFGSLIAMFIAFLLIKSLLIEEASKQEEFKTKRK